MYELISSLGRALSLIGRQLLRDSPRVSKPLREGVISPLISRFFLGQRRRESTGKGETGELERPGTNECVMRVTRRE